MKLEHIAIYTKNLDESIRFYKDCLELQFIETIDMGDHTLDYFSLGDGCLLELVSFPAPRDRAEGSKVHIALLTQDINAIHEKCKSFGVKILKEPAYVEKLKSVRMMLEDCNGVEIEFIQQSIAR